MLFRGKTPFAKKSLSPTRVVPPERRPVLVAAVTFAVVLVAALGAWRWVGEQSLRAANSRFDQRTAQITADLQREFVTGESLLRGARGLLAVAPAVNADAWHLYVAQLDLDETSSVVRALGYADVDADGVARLTGDAGNVAATTQPVAPVTQMAPATADAMPVGYDLAGAPASRKALLRAIDTGASALNAGAAPFGDIGSNTRPRLYIYFPVYSDGGLPPTPQARRAGIKRLLVAALDSGRVFDNALARQRSIDLQVLSGTPATLLYSSAAGDDDPAERAPVMRKTATLRVGGEPLTLSYTASSRSLRAEDAFAETAVLIAGIAAACLFGAIAFLIACERGVGSATTSEARSQLNLNEARMMGIIRSSMEAIITVDERQNIVIFNPMAEQVFGCTAMEAVGASLSRFIPERFRAGHERHVEQFGVTGVSDRQMGKQRVLFGLRNNGEEFPIEASISQIRDGDGKLYTVMLRDITERVKAENAQRQTREELRELSANLQKVREEEKTRIARELHDDLGQQLTALKMDISSVEQELENTADPRLLQQLRGMRRLIDATVASVRRIAADLRPVMLDDLGLIPAIEWLANDFTNRYGIDVERWIEVGDTCFTSAGATTLFRIVQEALTNVARHAEATLVTLTVHVEGGVCVVQIADNGQGSSHTAPSTEKSFGLLGIRERAHMLGGTVEIHTSSGKGFKLTVTFPVSAVQQQEMQT
ncbi:sensor histidine kinase [Paraburkholderia elongata]|uniref:histidine kinase n=1 Tax=Paraburkholderia elongata TaxID=2675747 RepID=A0A972SIJ6_9BURK|nr:PAS domain S-box protein [Paraburkholderia elongata]NPT56144.1 PAS domain S-box protein [Paraburkholderia elongata]